MRPGDQQQEIGLYVRLDGQLLSRMSETKVLEEQQLRAKESPMVRCWRQHTVRDNLVSRGCHNDLDVWMLGQVGVIEAQIVLFVQEQKSARDVACMKTAGDGRNGLKEGARGNRVVKKAAHPQNVKTQCCLCRAITRMHPYREGHPRSAKSGNVRSR